MDELHNKDNFSLIILLRLIDQTCSMCIGPYHSVINKSNAFFLGRNKSNASFTTFYFIFLLGLHLLHGMTKLDTVLEATLHITYTSLFMYYNILL